MAGLPLARADGAPARLSHAGETVDLARGETVLDALLRHGVDAPHSCRKGSCFSCMMRAVAGAPPAGSQDGLRDTLRDQGYLLACRAIPETDLEIALPDDDAVFGRATVVEVAALAPAIRRVRLAPQSPFDYHAGQFVNLRRADGLVRSYSLASVARLDATLEIHVKRLPRRPRGRRRARRPSPAGFHVYLCGHPAMVHATRKTAYLAGAALPDIHADPFETAPPLSLDLS